MDVAARAPPGVWEIHLDSGQILAPLDGYGTDFPQPAEELPAKLVSEVARALLL